MSKRFNSFCYIFGVFCFGFAIPSINYVLDGIKLYNFDNNAIVHMLLYFLLVNAAVSIFISTFLVKITSTKFVDNLSLSLFVYFTLAQVYFFYAAPELKIPSLWGLSAGIIAGLVCFILPFFYELNFIPFLSRLISNFSGLIFIGLLIFSIINPIFKKAEDLPEKDIAQNFKHLENVYKKFRSASKEKISVFMILFDEVPFTFLYDGKAIRDCFPNMKALSEKSLFFTKAFSNYDGTRRSVPSFFTGKYMTDRKYYNNDYFVRDWVLEFRNPFFDLGRCGYNIKSSSDGFDILQKIYPDTDLTKVKFYSEKTLILGTLHFFKVLASFGTIDFYDYFSFATDSSDISILKEINRDNLEKLPVFCFIYTEKNHTPYVYNRDGTKTDETPNVYSPIKLAGDKYAKLGHLVRERHTETLMYFDKLLGDRIKEIESLFNDNNFLIVFISDHGIGWRPPQLGRERGYINWDIVGVPLMIYSPLKIKPQVYNKPFPLIDLLPTLYDIIGLDYKNEEFDGISFFDKRREQQRDLFANSIGCQHVLQGDSWKEMKIAFPIVFNGRTIDKTGCDCKEIRAFNLNFKQ